MNQSRVLNLRYSTTGMMDGELDKRIEWSSKYNPDWDDEPEAYMRSGILAEGRSLRLGKLSYASMRFRAYLGVQHYDPLDWAQQGESYTCFWVSFLIGKQTITLQTFQTMRDCRSALWQFYSTLIRDRSF